VANIAFDRIILVRENRKNYPEINHYIKNFHDAYHAIITVTKCDQEAQEVFGIITLNIKNHIVSFCEIARGTLNQASLHPREVFKPAILNNAAGIILFHNHPSGDSTPSNEDIETTKRLIEAGNLLGINVLDHIIIGDSSYTSLKEKNFII